MWKWEFKRLEREVAREQWHLLSDDFFVLSNRDTETYF